MATPARSCCNRVWTNRNRSADSNIARELVTLWATSPNIRTTAADEKLFLTPPIELTLEAALELINEDELVEVTPKTIRLRKRILDHNERKRVEKLRDQGTEA